MYPFHHCYLGGTACLVTFNKYLILSIPSFVDFKFDFLVVLGTVKLLVVNIIYSYGSKNVEMVIGFWY